ncbi:MAG: flagellin modification protein PtmA [Bacteroidales bacterium]
MLKEKVIIVTGGAGLLGKEFIKSVIQNRGIGIIADYNEKLGIETKEKIRSELKSNNVEFIKTDITNKESILNLISIVRNKYGHIDSLVNNAYPRNKNYGRHFFDVDYEDFCENVNMHLGGYFLTSQQFAKYFVEQGHGNIINIASIYGVIAPRFEIYEGTNMTTPVEYAVIKSAIIHFTKYLAKYLKGKNIRVNSISPGGILDNQPEEFIKKYNSFGLSKGMLDRKDIVGTLLFMLSDMSEFINGQNIVVDDGYSL